VLRPAALGAPADDRHRAWSGCPPEASKGGRPRVPSALGPEVHRSADGQEMDKSARSPIHRLAKLLSGLVELPGIEAVTS
jgi:hypothetical protein